MTTTTTITQSHNNNNIDDVLIQHPHDNDSHSMNNVDGQHDPPPSTTSATTTTTTDVSLKHSSTGVLLHTDAMNSSSISSNNSSLQSSSSLLYSSTASLLHQQHQQQPEQKHTPSQPALKQPEQQQEQDSFNNTPYQSLKHGEKVLLFTHDGASFRPLLKGSNDKVFTPILSPIPTLQHQSTTTTRQQISSPLKSNISILTAPTNNIYNNVNNNTNSTEDIDNIQSPSPFKEIPLTPDINNQPKNETSTTSNNTNNNNNNNHNNMNISRPTTPIHNNPIKNSSNIPLRASVTRTPIKSSLGASTMLKMSQFLGQGASTLSSSMMSDHIVLHASSDISFEPNNIRTTGGIGMGGHGILNTIPMTTITTKRRDTVHLLGEFPDDEQLEDAESITKTKTKFQETDNQIQFDDTTDDAQALDILEETGDAVELEVQDESIFVKIKRIINERIGMVYVVLSTFLFSLMALGVKAMAKNISSLQVGFIRSIIGLIGCLSILSILKVNPLGDKSKRVFLTLRGLSGAISLSGYFITLATLPLSEAVCISFTSPVITAAMAAIVLKEKWGKLEAATAFLSLVGVAIISKPAFIFGASADAGGSATGNLKLLYIFIGIVGAFFSAVSFITVRKIGPGTNPFVLVLYFSLVSSLVLPLSMFYKPFVMPTAQEWAVIIVLSVVALVAQVCINRGIQLIAVAKAASLNYMQIVWTFIWELAFIHEAIDVWSVLGALLIISCAVVNLFRK